MPASEPHHIIAIGASAGGIEEIHTFFEHTPLDGVAYVVIQHLSPDFKSRMVELLSRHSKLLVKEAENRMIVKKNHVYLIPSDKFMIIRNGALYLSDKDKVKLPHLTINSFFQTMAADCGSKAIGIILSGLGSDGTEGIRAIKNAGGMIMARNPETSSFASMPASAITTGMVDFILEPAEMPQAIEDYLKYGGELLADNKDDETNITAIIELIKAHSPLDFSDYKKTTILRRTKRRAASKNFNTLGGYLNHLKSTPEETEALAKEFLISVTAFFRDQEAFNFIQKEVIPDILKSLYPGQELKMWIAGCATGEEVYSIAILVAELLTNDLKDTVVKIFATDIDNVALTHAGRGIYNAEIIKNVSPERLERYFIHEGNNYRVKPEIRKMVIFAQHDLVKNPPYCNMDFISCRNLLIYMTPILQKKIFNMFLFGLKTEGYLFLGSSENPMPIIKNLDVVNTKFKIFKTLETKRESSFDTFSLPDLQEMKRIPFPLSREETLNSSSPGLAETIHRSLANNLDYLAICVDENLHVVKSYGDTRFLLRKHFTTDLSDLLPKSLNVALNTLRNRSLKTNEIATASGIRIKLDQVELSVTLSVSPLLNNNGNQKFLLITITEDKPSKFGQERSEGAFDEKIYHDQYTLNLEEEVRELKERLNSAYEQLNSSNENLQSFNEELLSANEEMQSTNEEMQSVNEELHTINADYQLKNKELLEANDDLNNYFRSNINGQLFVDRDLRLMKFSPGTVRQINLLETDIGRPISNITTNIKFETIVNDVKQVIREGGVIHKEIETNDGKWYQIMTMPYIQQADHGNNGAIITFNDITELKKTQQELIYSNKLLGIAINSADMGTWSLNVHTREFVSSPRLKEIFGFHQDEELTFETAISKIAKEHQSQVLDAIETAINQDVKFDIEYPLERVYDGQMRWVRATGNVTYNKEGKPDYFTGVLHDITEFKQDNIRKNDFIAMVSHDLRAPLTSLYGYIHMLALKAKKSEDTYGIDMLDKVYAQARKMTSLVEGFLNVSHMEAGKIRLDKQIFEINDLVKEIVEETVTTRSHNVSMHLCSDLEINADRNKIGQVINNLLSNAMKYSPLGTNIDISCNIIKGSLLVSVKDKGGGIKIEDQDKLFDRFYRVDNMQAQTVSGFGLGLYLSAEIIKRHDGEIWVESAINKGSTFHFKLPL